MKQKGGKLLPESKLKAATTGATESYPSEDPPGSLEAI